MIKLNFSGYRTFPTTLPNQAAVAFAYGVVASVTPNIDDVVLLQFTDGTWEMHFDDTKAKDAENVRQKLGPR